MNNPNLMKIKFTGTSAMLSKLQLAVMGFATIGASLDGAVHLCEVRIESDIKKIPKSSPVPLFLLINTRERSIIQQIKGYSISGIFVPPFDADAVKSKLLALSRSDVNPSYTEEEHKDSLLIKILAKAESMSTLPVFAQKLLKLTTNDASTIKEITDQIKQDQGVSSRVMRMINSPFFGVREEISSIDRAVVLLGFQTLKNIALVVSTSSYYNKPFELYNTSGTALWQHTYKVALVSETIAKELGLNTEVHFLAGLLHDIGKTILVDFLKYEVKSPEDEVKQLGIDHAKIAGIVLKQWKLSSEVANIVARHHEPSEDISSRVLYASNLISHSVTTDILERTVTDLGEFLPDRVVKSIQNNTQEILFPDMVGTA